MRINVNKPYLPSFDKYLYHLERMYANQWLTNNGPLLKEFTERLRAYLNVPYLVPTSSGTSALQLAYNLFNLKGNVVTTPFSFIATSNSADWVGLGLRFSDIDAGTLNISASGIERNMDKHTSAIVAVHTYGNPCDTDALHSLSLRHDIKLIYDAAHAFGIEKHGKSILTCGHASAISLHATKVFHCIEGGALILNNHSDYERALCMINFGIDERNGEICNRGFNAKMSEAHAAMGLAMLDDIDHVISRRLEHYYQYKTMLSEVVEFPLWDSAANQNAAYFPVLFQNKTEMLHVFHKLKENGIESRRYFSPSLHSLGHYRSRAKSQCPVAESMVDRVLCLPMFYALNKKQITKICNIVMSSVGLVYA